MTGFGAAEGAVAGGWLRLEIRTVNHRYFNLAAKLPGELSALEGELRERLRREFDRGHVAVQARWTEYPGARRRLHGGSRSGPARHRAAAGAAGRAGPRRRGDAGAGGAAARRPLARRANDPAEVAWSEVEPIVAQAAAECRAMRAREGEALAAELRHRLDLLEASAERIAARAPERLVRERDRLRAAVAELLDGRAADEARLAQELAFQADRLDITEELVRFRAHVAASRDALTADKPAGKQLGFLAQELGREVNTMGAKANDAEIAHEVIAMKGELEKFREQLENLE